MIPQNQAKIFLAKDRVVTEFAGLTSWHIATAADRHSPIINPFITLKDTVLAPGNRVNIVANDGADILLVPIAGTILYSINRAKKRSIAAGTVNFFSLNQKDSIQVTNGYKEEYINFLELEIKPGSVNIPVECFCASFDLDLYKNNVVRLFDNEEGNTSSAGFYIGKFDGRQNLLFHLSKPGNALFVFIIEGAFEVQYRLLETRDGLLLRNADHADIEALSNDAVLFLVEVKDWN